MEHFQKITKREIFRPMFAPLKVVVINTNFFNKYLKIPSSPPCPERHWDPHSLLSNGYQGLFPWG